VAGEARQLAVLGVGNRLRGDDAIGCIVCDELIGESPNAKRRTSSEEPSPRYQRTEKPLADSSLGIRQSPVPGLFVLDCGSTPENYVQPIADRNPARILVVDCCDFGGGPGEFGLFNRAEIDRLSYGLISTHTLPLTLTIEMLSLETKAAIELLGIQPQQIEFNTDLSPAVRAALPGLVQFIRNWARR